MYRQKKYRDTIQFQLIFAALVDVLFIFGSFRNIGSDKKRNTAKASARGRVALSISSHEQTH